MTEQRAPLLRARICQVTSEFQDAAIQKAGVLLSPQAGTCLERSTTVGPQHREALAHRLGQSTDLGQVYPVSLVLSCLVPSGWAHSKATQPLRWSGPALRGTTQGVAPAAAAIPRVLSGPDATRLGSLGCEFPALQKD